MIEKIKKQFGDNSFMLDAKIIGDKVFFTVVAKSNNTDVFFGPVKELECSLEDAEENIINYLAEIREENKKEIDILDKTTPKPNPKPVEKVEKPKVEEDIPQSPDPRLKRTTRTLDL